MNKLFLIAAFALIMTVSFAAIDNCADADETSCTECATGYGLKAGDEETDPVTCQKCTKDNCVACDLVTPATCTECAAGYGLLTASGTSCGKCADTCTNCNGNVDECLACKTGYTLLDSEGVAAKTCSACANGCVSCTRVDDSCSACPTGHAKNEANKDNVFCCANTNCTACSTVNNCTACATGVNLDAEKGTCFGFKSGASLTLGAVLSVALFSLLF